MTHKLLARQLKRSLGIKDEAALQELLSRVTELAQTPGVPPLLARVLPQAGAFLAMISEAYEMNDRDLLLRTRSLELSSQELVAANDKVRREAAEQQLVLDSLRQTANRLARDAGLPALELGGKTAQQTSNFVAQLVEERTQAQAAAHDREQEARRAQAQLASAIESLDAGFAMWGPDERLVTSNHRFEELHPYYQGQMVPGRTLREVLEGTLANMGGQPYDGSDGATWIERQMAAIRSAPREIVKQVGRRWIRITDTRAADGGVVSLRTDVSSLKEAGEELRRAKEAAESANQAKSDFLANMSHEIRTPMNGIMGMTRLALDTELQPDQRRYINLVKVSADNLLAIIDDILDFSKIDAGKMEVDDEDFSLVETLEPMLRTLAVRAHEKKLQLGVVIGPEVPDGLRGDAGRLRQILNNLIGNALKFTEHGEVTLRVKVAQATGRELTLSFAVTDTGIGIPLDKQKLVFDAFSQADASTTRKYGGTGLGLTISSRLVALMGGSISLESGPGRGSCFRFTVKVGLARRAPRRKVAPIELRGKRVLVVDDNATNREAFRGMLTRWGLDVTASADGEAGLNELERAAAEGVPYQLAIIDGCMQEPDGPALIALVRGRAALDNVRMVLATSDVMPKKAGLPADVVAISKPAIGDELLEAILRALGGERPTPAQQVVAMAPKAPAGPRLRILVAEDNEVNQEIIRRRLEHQGHEVRLVDNGQEAAALIANETWDLVLMDVQMPSMGGFEATRLVREREAGGQRRTAIVALTAHAMKGDKERCLAAGMDGYLTKPLDWSAVNATIARFAQGQPQVTAAKSDATEACGPIDHERALQTVDGDRKLLSKVAGMFAKKLPRLLDSLRKAEETRDCAGLHANAHALVGAARNLGATSLAEAAGELETAAISCRWTEAEPMLVRVAEEVGRAIPELLQMTG